PITPTTRPFAPNLTRLLDAVPFSARRPRPGHCHGRLGGRPIPPTRPADLPALLPAGVPTHLSAALPVADRHAARADAPRCHPHRSDTGRDVLRRIRER